MYQILRSCKFKIHVYSRCYGNQSKQRTHYETLRIPQTSSQKEIRDAFIKLSKEMHPDIKGKASHSEFVKVNEAYKILSKENLRREYDMNIRSGNGYEYTPDNSSYAPYSSYPSHPYTSQQAKYAYGYQRRQQYNSREEWEEYVSSQTDDNYYGLRGIKRMKTIWIALVCTFFATIIVILQIIHMNKTLLDSRQLVISRSTRYQQDYRRLQKEAEGKTKDEQLRDFESKIRTENPEISPLDAIN